MLEVAIHGDDVFSARVIETCGQCGCLSKVAPQADYRDTAIHAGDLAQQVKSVVGGAVIDEDNFETLSANFHYGFQPIIEVGDVFLLVVDGNDNRVLQHESPNYTVPAVKFI